MPESFQVSSGISIGPVVGMSGVGIYEGCPQSGRNGCMACQGQESISNDRESRQFDDSMTRG